MPPFQTHPFAPRSVRARRSAAQLFAEQPGGRRVRAGCADGEFIGQACDLPQSSACNRLLPQSDTSASEVGLSRLFRERVLRPCAGCVLKSAVCAVVTREAVQASCSAAAFTAVRGVRRQIQSLPSCTVPGRLALQSGKCLFILPQGVVVKLVCSESGCSHCFCRLSSRNLCCFH